MIRRKRRSAQPDKPINKIVSDLTILLAESTVAVADLTELLKEGS